MSTIAGINYDLIKQIIESIMVSGESKIIIVDSAGNIISDIPISTITRTRVYEQSFEDGTTDTTANNATQTVQSTEVYAGNYALQVTISANQTGYVETPQRPVSPGQKVTFAFAHKEDANISDIKLIVVWYRANGNVLSTEEFTLDVTDTWKLEGRTVTAPQNSAYMALRIQATAGASDGNVFIDDITIDLVGQIFRVDGAGQIKVADTDLLEALIDNVKGAWRLGAKDLTVNSDEILNIASGEEFSVNNLTINGRMRVKGVLDICGDLDVIGEIDVIGEVNVGV